MPDDLAAVIAETRTRVRTLLAAQCLDPRSPSHGGFITDDTAYADSRNSIYAGMSLFAAYLSPALPESHGSPAVLERIRLLLAFMERRQFSDGTITLGSNAAPGCAEVGFTLPGLCAIYERAIASQLPGCGEIARHLRTFIERGADACRRLRPFTANHRWTACAGPLALIDRILPHPGNQPVIDDLLADGIDCDEDGFWYEERSPNYNMVADWGMLHLADGLGDRRFLDAAWRNCRNVLRFIQPNGEADTSFSHRQDRGAADRPWGDWWIFRRLAIEYGDGLLATAADMLLRRLDQHADPFIPWLFLLEDGRYQRNGVHRLPLPEAIDFHGASLPIHRWRQAQVAATVMADAGGHWWDAVYGGWGSPLRSNLLMSCHHGSAIIDGIKLTWGSGAGGLRPERIERQADGSLRLDCHDYGLDHIPHYRRPERRMPAHLAVDQQASLVVTPLPGMAFRLDCRVDGRAGMPINFQFLLRPGCRLALPDGQWLDPVIGQLVFTAHAGDHLVLGPDGRRWRIHGLPEGQHRLATGDGSHIPGQAEQRCPRLIHGAFTPWHQTVILTPEVG